MEELTTTLQGILNSEEGMKQVQNLMQALGVGENTQEASSAAVDPQQQNGGGLDLSGLLGMLGDSSGNATPAAPSRQKEGGIDLSGLLQSFGASNPSSPTSQQQNALPFDPAQILNLMQLFQTVKQDNPRTVFLQALRPLLREERRHKVDEAIRIMQLISLWPVIKESGILQNFLGDFGK